MSELDPVTGAADSPPLEVLADGFVALGSDPFEETIEADPFLEGLADLGVELLPPTQLDAEMPGSLPQAQRVVRPVADAPREDVPAPLSKPASVLDPTWTSTPPLAEVEVPDADGWLDQLLGPEERQRLAALSHLVESEASLDRYGFSPDVARRAFPFMYALYRLYFRVQSRGGENLPTRGPVVLAANHGGLLPFDAAMLVVDLLLQTDPPRLARAIVDRWAGTLPWLNVFYARVGQVVGTRENFGGLLSSGQLVLVFPEGMHGILKPISQRYRMQQFRTGFIEEALKAGAPIVPTAVIGSDDQSPILHDFRGIASKLGLPTLPVTPTFPWLGPLGLLPYPVCYQIVYGEPLDVHERFGPDDASDSRLVQYLAKQVRARVQHLVDKHR